MKRFSLIAFCCFWYLVSAQNIEIKQSIDDLNNKIEQSTKGEKLEWLDSLAKIVSFKPEFRYDSIARTTIALALTLDSLKLATNHTSSLIDFQNNILGKSQIALNIFEEFLPKIEKLKDNMSLARFYLNGGDSYFFTGDYKTSIQYYNKTKEYALKANNQELVGLSQLYAAFNSLRLGAFAESSQGLQEAILIFKELKDTTRISRAKTALTILYSQNAFFDEAKKEREDLIKLNVKRKNYGDLATNYYNASLDEKTKGNNIERLNYLKLALLNTRKSKYNKVQEPVFLSSMVITYSLLDSISNAEKYLKEIENNPSQNTEGKNKSVYYEALMYLAYAKKEYPKALEYGKMHLDLVTKKPYSSKRQANKFLSDVYVQLGNEKMAFSHFKVYNKIKDSITSVQKARALSYYQTLYETEKRDLKILAQESDIELLNVKNKTKNQWMLFGSIGLFALFGFVLLLRSKRKAKEQKILQEQFSQDLMLSQENERTRIAKELHDSVGQQLTLIKKKSQNSNLEEITNLTHNALEEVRGISRGLYPAMLKQLGLKESIEQLIYEFDEETELFFTSEIDEIDKFLDQKKSLNFYRFIQECLTNIIKHSQAKTVSLTIKNKDGNILTVLSDNGIGFDIKQTLKQNNLGLKTIIERIKILKGKIIIDSTPKKGTSILATIPIS